MAQKMVAAHQVNLVLVDLHPPHDVDQLSNRTTLDLPPLVRVHGCSMLQHSQRRAGQQAEKAHGAHGLPFFGRFTAACAVFSASSSAVRGGRLPAPAVPRQHQSAAHAVDLASRLVGSSSTERDFNRNELNFPERADASGHAYAHHADGPCVRPAPAAAATNRI